MIDYTIGHEPRQQTGRELFFKGDVKTLTINYGPWADDNANVTTVTWSVEKGQASIVSNSLTDNEARVTISTHESGNSIIRATATDGTNTNIFFIRIKTKDPSIDLGCSDYCL